jgi:hypothetical protein
MTKNIPTFHMIYKLAFLATLLITISCGRQGSNNKKTIIIKEIGIEEDNIEENENESTFETLSTSSPVIGRLLQENPCRVGNGQRIPVSIRLNINVAANQTYAGVTSEGDIAIVTNQGNGAVLTAQICARQSAQSGQGSLMGNPVLNHSPNCQVNEISSASMQLPGVMGTVYLFFVPVYYDNNSSLCNR